MALDDIVDDVEEEVNQLSDDEIEDFIDRVATISKVLAQLDKKVEEIESDMEDLERVCGVLMDEVKIIRGESDKDSFLEQVDEEDGQDEVKKRWSSE